MRTSHQPRHWAIVGTVAAILLVIWTTALGGSPYTAAKSQDSEPVRAQASNPISVTEELVKLEDSLQWNGKTPIEVPVSPFVTDLLPGNC